MTQEKIDRINALAKKAKSPEGLTAEETAERDALRRASKINDIVVETAIGALALYISDETVAHFQPMNVNFGIMPPLGYRVKGKRNKNAALSQRALECLAGLGPL